MTVCLRSWKRRRWRPAPSLALCLNELDRCDAVILLIGSKAGSVVPNASGLTYTEAEIERVELFWRMGELDVETLSALDEWSHADPSRLQALAPLVRQCHEPIAIECPIFAMHACQVAAAAGAGAAERIATAFVGNAMPNQWSHAPGTAAPAFTEVAGRARRIHEMLGPVPHAEVFKKLRTKPFGLAVRTQKITIRHFVCDRGAHGRPRFRSDRERTLKETRLESGNRPYILARRRRAVRFVVCVPPHCVRNCVTNECSSLVSTASGANASATAIAV